MKSQVVNYDAPDHVEDYVHRAGRTGRRGQAGCQCLSFLAPDDAAGAQAREIAQTEKRNAHGCRADTRNAAKRKF